MHVLKVRKQKIELREYSKPVFLVVVYFLLLHWMFNNKLFVLTLSFFCLSLFFEIFFLLNFKQLFGVVIVLIFQMHLVQVVHKKHRIIHQPVWMNCKISKTKKKS